MPNPDPLRLPFGVFFRGGAKTKPFEGLCTLENLVAGGHAIRVECLWWSKAIPVRFVEALELQIFIINNGWFIGFVNALAASFDSSVFSQSSSSFSVECSRKSSLGSFFSWKYILGREVLVGVLVGVLSFYTSGGGAEKALALVWNV